MRQASSPLPWPMGSRSSVPARRSPIRPCSTATSAISRSPRSSRAIDAPSTSSSAACIPATASAFAERSGRARSSSAASRRAARRPQGRGRSAIWYMHAVRSPRRAVMISVMRSPKGKGSTGARKVRLVRSTSRSSHAVSRAGSVWARSARAAGESPASARAVSLCRSRVSTREPSREETRSNCSPFGANRTRQRTPRCRRSPLPVS